MRDRFEYTLPLWPVDDEGRCECGQSGCKRPYKHPRFSEGPSNGYAVVTGEEGGLFVLDVDVKGGKDGYTELEALGPVPETLTVRTATGGAHFYFQHPGFRVSCRKPSPGIDIKGDKDREDGLVYVVGPGSPGVDMEGNPASYEVVLDAPVAPAPEWLLAWLQIGDTRKEGFAPPPIDEGHVDWEYRLRLGEKAAKEFPPSKADGEGGKRLFAICIRLVRALELPLDVAQSLIEEHFNPRCTTADGAPWPWSDEELRHKLEDARDRSDIPCGIFSEATTKGISEALAGRGNVNRTPKPPAPTSTKDKVDAARAYDGERVKVTRAGLTQMLYNWPDWDGVLWFDTLARKPRATNPPLAGKLTLEDGELSRGDFSLIAHWLDVKGFLASKELIEDAVQTVVRSPDRQRNLIAEYLDSLPKVTEAKTLATLATDVFGATDPFANTLLTKTLIAAVRRARNPGHFHKAMLVLKGKQQCGKTPAIKILAGPWYHSTGNGNLADRDTILECQGKLLVEVEELSALNKADADALKTAISRTADVITKKYEPDGRTYPRSFVLIGTTNKDEFLTDATGNARYHVIEVGQIDLARLEELRDQIWAEADFLAQTTDARSNELLGDEAATVESANKGYLNTHPWFDEVARYLKGRTEVTSTAEVLMHVLKGDLTKADKRAKNEVADIMRALECENRPVWRDGRTMRIWFVPSDLPVRTSPVLRVLKGKDT